MLRAPTPRRHHAGATARPSPCRSGGVQPATVQCVRARPGSAHHDSAHRLPARPGAAPARAAGAIGDCR
eukprot:4159285-Prymnesium_polylepis.1